MSKDSLVVMKARKIGNLSKMEGKIEMGKEEVLSKEASIYSFLCHKQMVHMHEKGLQVWKNHELLPYLQYLNFYKFYIFVGYDHGVK